MQERICPECDEPVCGRRKRHPECRSKAHARWKREKRAGGQWAGEYPPLGGEVPVVDYTRPGSASRPPSFDNHPVTRQESRPDQEPVDYTGIRPSRPSIYAQDMSMDGVPGATRRDLVQAQAEARRIAAEDEEVPDPDSWEGVLARNQAPDRMISFRPAMDGSILRGGGIPMTASPYAAAILGQAVVAPKPRQKPPSQRVPHIIAN